MENQETQKSPNAFVAFFQILLTIFKNPINGLANYYKSKEKHGLAVPIILIIIAVILFVSIPFLTTVFAYARYIRYISTAFTVDFFITTFNLGLIPIFFVGFLALFTFLMKLIVAKKANFMQAFQMASFQTVLLSVLMLVVLTFSIFSGGFSLTSFNLSFWGGLYLLIVFYFLLMIISSVKQTLTLDNVEVKEILLWYVSPAIVLLSIYFSTLIYSGLTSFFSAILHYGLR